MSFFDTSLLWVAVNQQQQKVESQRRVKRKIRRKRRLRIKSKIDQDQDQLLEELQVENEQLQICLGSLVQTLVAKGILSGEELQQILQKTSGPEEGED
jgi:hypothetical protein